MEAKEKIEIKKEESEVLGENVVEEVGVPEEFQDNQDTTSIDAFDKKHTIKKQIAVKNWKKIKQSIKPKEINLTEKVQEIVEENKD